MTPDAIPDGNTAMGVIHAVTPGNLDGISTAVTVAS